MSYMKSENHKKNNPVSPGGRGAVHRVAPYLLCSFITFQLCVFFCSHLENVKDSKRHERKRAKWASSFGIILNNAKDETRSRKTLDERFVAWCIARDQCSVLRPTLFNLMSAARRSGSPHPLANVILFLH